MLMAVMVGSRQFVVNFQGGGEGCHRHQKAGHEQSKKTAARFDEHHCVLKFL